MKPSKKLPPLDLGAMKRAIQHLDLCGAAPRKLLEECRRLKAENKALYGALERVLARLRDPDNAYDDNSDCLTECEDLICGALDRVKEDKEDEL